MDAGHAAIAADLRDVFNDRRMTEGQQRDAALPPLRLSSEHAGCVARFLGQAEFQNERFGLVLPSWVWSRPEGDLLKALRSRLWDINGDEDLCDSVLLAAVLQDPGNPHDPAARSRFVDSVMRTPRFCSARAVAIATSPHLVRLEGLDVRIRPVDMEEVD
jgi:hypothetical protein